MLGEMSAESVMVSVTVCVGSVLVRCCCFLFLRKQEDVLTKPGGRCMLAN